MCTPTVSTMFEPRPPPLTAPYPTTLNTTCINCWCSRAYTGEHSNFLPFSGETFHVPRHFAYPCALLAAPRCIIVFALVHHNSALPRHISIYIPSHIPGLTSQAANLEARSMHRESPHQLYFPLSTVDTRHTYHALFVLANQYEVFLSAPPLLPLPPATVVQHTIPPNAGQTTCA